jgi:hypothetical protein
VLLLVACLGCAPSGNRGGEVYDNFAPLNLDRYPSVQTLKDLAFSAGGYKTFSVFSPSLASSTPRISGLLEQNMLFQLRNALEVRGYRFVEPTQSPDFVVTIDGGVEHHDQYVPPQTVLAPVFVPGRMITSFGNQHGYIYGGRGGLGSYSGTSSSVTYMPGYVAAQPQVQPGYTVGIDMPLISVSVYDGKSLKAAGS